LLSSKTRLITSRFPPLGQMWLMEKNIATRKVELTGTFNEVWQSLCGRSVELETDAGTPFIAKAKFAKRRGSSTLAEVLVFLRKDGDRLIECSRCYAANWGFYFNNLGVGQRIGMFCRAIDFLG
jgi:hypothetical protein